MIEVNQTYDLLPGIDQKAYGEYVKKEMGRFRKETPGLVEIRAHRNVLGSPRRFNLGLIQRSLLQQ